MCKRWVSMVVMVLLVAGLGACGRTGEATPDEAFRPIYQLAVDAGAIEDMSYEEWLETIRGDDGKDG